MYADMLTCLFFFFNDTATTEIYTLSLHDALPISPRRRAGGMGARTFLAIVLPGRPSSRRDDLGAPRRTVRRNAFVRLLDRQRAAGRGALERRHQLRRRDLVHLRRPHRAADPEHLPEVLRGADDVVSALHLVRLDGARGPGGRVAVSRAGFRSVPAAGHRDGAARDVQLHDGAESQLPRAGGRARRSVHADGRAEDAPDDESARRSRPRRAGASPPSVPTARVIGPASCERAAQPAPSSPSSCGRFPPRWPWHRAIAWLWARCARARAAPRPVSRRARRSVT